jgi:hypothetical protein
MTQPTTMTHAELVALVENLTDRVLAAEGAQADAEDLRRENASLREALATGSLSAPEAIERLRSWLPDYDHTAPFIAMPASMARTLIIELDRLTGAGKPWIEWGISHPHTSVPIYYGREITARQAAEDAGAVLMHRFVVRRQDTVGPWIEGEPAAADPITQREQLVHDDPALAEQIRRGLGEAERGETVDLGTFSQYADEEG